MARQWDFPSFSALLRMFTVLDFCLQFMDNSTFVTWDDQSFSLSPKYFCLRKNVYFTANAFLRFYRSACKVVKFRHPCHVTGFQKTYFNVIHVILSQSNWHLCKYQPKPKITCNYQFLLQTYLNLLIMHYFLRPLWGSLFSTCNACINLECFTTERLFDHHYNSSDIAELPW